MSILPEPDLPFRAIRAEPGYSNARTTLTFPSYLVRAELLGCSDYFAVHPVLLGCSDYFDHSELSGQSSEARNVPIRAARTLRKEERFF